MFLRMIFFHKLYDKNMYNFKERRTSLDDKGILYNKFFKQRIKEEGNKYKKYKNKLRKITTIHL